MTDSVRSYEDLLRENAALRLTLALSGSGPSAPRAQDGPAVAALGMDETLQKSHAFIRQIIDTDPNFIFAKDREGRFTLVNRAVADCYGTTVEDLLGKTDADFNPDAEQVRQFQHADRTVIDNGSDLFIPEEIVTDASGSMRWLQTVKRPLFDEHGRVTQVLGVATDISERKRVEQALRESEERLRLALAGGEMGAWDVDLASHAARWDGKTIALFGLDEEGAKPLPESFFDRIHPEDRTTVREAVRLALERSGTLEHEFRVRLGDGRARWLAAKGHVLKDERGVPVRMIGVAFDVTERKRAETRLRFFTEELEGRVAERTGELVDLHGRLRALTTALHLTEQRERKRLATDLHDYLAQLLALLRIRLTQIRRVMPAHEELAQEAEAVVNEALTYTRTLIAQLSPPVLHEFGLPVALKWLAEQMVRQELSVEIRQAVPDQLPLPEDQAVLLFQSVRELLMNVRKHAGIDRAVVAAEQDQGELRITVRDEGAGMDPSAQAHAHRTSAASSKFGLFSIRERMLAVGGRFELASAPGRGTTCRLIVPFPGAAAGTEEPNPERQTAASRHAGLRIPHREFGHSAMIRVLLVDDHPMAREGLKGLLHDYSDVVIAGEARDGAEAIAFVDKLSPHCVVMDVNMPRIDGIEATRRIKAAFPHVGIVGLSVNASPEVERAMRKAGADDFLLKDAPAGILYRRIRAVAKGLDHPPGEGRIGHAGIPPP